MPTLPIMLDTTDIETMRNVHDCLSGLKTPSGNARFRGVVRSGSYGEVVLFELESNLPLSASLAPLGQHVLAVTSLRGHLQVVSGNEKRILGPADSMALDPYRKLVVRSQAGARIQMIRLSRCAVERAFGDACAASVASPVRFALAPPVSPEAQQLWLLVSMHASQAMASINGRTDFPLAARQFERSLATVLVETHPLLRAPASEATDVDLPGTLLRALTLVQAHPDRSLGVEDLASVAGLSPRALQAAFQRHLGLSPLAFVRQVRFERAHSELLASDPENGVTIAQVARRWGFGNLGRFSRDYADRFGCLPSETLHLRA